MWLLIDLALVGVFAAIGRASHGESLDVAGWMSTTWPFLLGVVGAHWGLRSFPRFPPSALISGALIWMLALITGMQGRHLLGEGTALPFVIVAAVVLAAFLLLPRALVAQRRRARDREVTTSREPA